MTDLYENIAEQVWRVTCEYVPVSAPHMRVVVEPQKKIAFLERMTSLHDVTSNQVYLVLGECVRTCFEVTGSYRWEPVVWCGGCRVQVCHQRPCLKELQHFLIVGGIAWFDRLNLSSEFRSEYPDSVTPVHKYLLGESINFYREPGHRSETNGQIRIIHNVSQAPGIPWI